MKNSNIIEVIMKAAEKYDVSSVGELINCLEDDQELFEGG